MYEYDYMFYEMGYFVLPVSTNLINRLRCCDSEGLDSRVTQDCNGTLIVWEKSDIAYTSSGWEPMDWWDSWYYSSFLSVIRYNIRNGNANKCNMSLFDFKDTYNTFFNAFCRKCESKEWVGAGKGYHVCNNCSSRW